MKKSTGTCWWQPEIRPSPVEGTVLYPTIYRLLAPSQVVVWDFWTINSITKNIGLQVKSLANDSCSWSFDRGDQNPSTFPRICLHVTLESPFFPPNTSHSLLGGVSKTIVHLYILGTKMSISSTTSWNFHSHSCLRPWKSKTMKIIVPNFGWWKIPC